MEVEAALTMFQRSWAKHGLRYTTVLSVGDSRTFHALSEAERMGAALRNIVDKKKAQGESLGGRGKLTQEDQEDRELLRICPEEQLSMTVPAMKRAVEATLLHMTSTDDAPKHSKCPEGALANGESLPSHKNALPACVAGCSGAVFARLSDERLLARCCEGRPRTRSMGTLRVESVKRAEAVAIYNQGRRATNESIAARLGYVAGDALFDEALEKTLCVTQGKCNLSEAAPTTKKTLAQGDTKRVLQLN
ncbi:hypothetical protein HPB52_025517 [Rhipicephalus sanguineus]|uniref:Uncharacterized protein n=1 Tax=Rhipicephalus sanguineus TaxID=34632 RepID=A0A9D4TCX4_RHISA|nr:hypothetical protein HPB52_025517 [Rhipicephalus sanguineus]